MKLSELKDVYHGVQLSDQVCMSFTWTLKKFNIAQHYYGTFYAKLACKMRDYYELY